MAVIELLNALGVSLSANPSSSESTQKLGSHLTIAAISMQLAAICIFVILSAIFHRRCIRARIRARPVSTPLNTMYVSMGLILVRCIYRLVEHLDFTSIDLNDYESLLRLSPILRYEWFFYVFEATLMLLNSVLWNVWNPARYLPGKYHVYLAKDGVTELEGKEDNRSLQHKLISMATFGLFFRKKIQGPPFQELEDYPTSVRSTQQ